MKHTLPAVFIALLLALSGLATTRPAAANDLVVSADTPEVTVSTRPAGQRFIKLPALKYEFTVSARCDAGLSPAALSLSIADTRVTLSAEELSSGPPVRLFISIPESQIAPVTVESFCAHDADNDANDNARKVRISALLSAQVSLLCGNEITKEMTYASEALDVTVACELPAEQEMYSID